MFLFDIVLQGCIICRYRWTQVMICLHFLKVKFSTKHKKASKNYSNYRFSSVLLKRLVENIHNHPLRHSLKTLSYSLLQVSYELIKLLSLKTCYQNDKLFLLLRTIKFSVSILISLIRHDFEKVIIYWIGIIMFTTMAMSTLEPTIPIWILDTMKAQKWQLGTTSTLLEYILWNTSFQFVMHVYVIV